jgi:hypothetical protein
MRHFRGILSKGLKVEREAREYSRHLLSGTRHNPHWLGGMKQVECRIWRLLREPLDSQITVRCDVANYIAGFVDGGNQQAMGPTAADCDIQIAEIVGLRTEAL